MNKKSKLKKILPNIILGLFFLAGLCIFLYPSVSNLINQWTQNREIDKYFEIVSDISTEEMDSKIADAQAYNSEIAGNNLTYNRENLDENRYSKLLAVDSTGMMGFLRINKIGVKLPIYHSTDESVLQIGIGHLAGSSLPVDGESVHTVLSGHTGLPSAKLLTDLAELEVGDTFIIGVLNRVYTYEVDQILVVEPDETDEIEIVPGKQYATLITCTPYGVNTHRLLVRGELRNNEENLDLSNEAIIIDSSVIVPIISIPVILVLFIIMIIIRNKNNKKEEGNEDEEKIKSNDGN